jgi:hypothetical protein
VQGHTVNDLEALIEAPRPEVKAAEPIVELLDTAPAIITRPLTLLNGMAYVATWLHASAKTTETTDKSGAIIKLNPPRVAVEQRLFIVRSDGRIYGAGGDEPLINLGAEVRLPEVPPADRLWSARGVKAYRANQRPDPAELFARVVNGTGRYIDFKRSLADQQVMAELLACYVLATWFLDAFNVIGFL